MRETWLNENQRLVSQDNFGNDIAAVEAATKKHEAIETDIMVCWSTFLLFEEDNIIMLQLAQLISYLGYVQLYSVRDDILFIHRPMKNVSKPLFKLQMNYIGKTTMNPIGSSKGWFLLQFLLHFSFISSFFFLVKIKYNLALLPMNWVFTISWKSPIESYLAILVRMNSYIFHCSDC